MCLVNDAVYIAKYKNGDWTATGTQFQIPYVFKKLFSKQPIEFEDMCETKSVTSALYLDMNEDLPDVSNAEIELDNRRSNAQRTRQDDTFGDRDRSGKITLKKLNPKFNDVSDEDLKTEIENGHNYIFIGKIGQFCPIKPGCGGGVLCREATDPKTGEKKYASATGAKGYRWLESETVKLLEKEDDIDRSYYNRLVDEAVETISKYGDFEQFVAEGDESALFDVR